MMKTTIHKQTGQLFQQALASYMTFSIYLGMYRRCPSVGPAIIFGGDGERFAHFSAKNLIEFGLMVEKSHSKMQKNVGFC